MNPRAATNDLLPFQGSPFSHLGTSPNALLIVKQYLYEDRITESVGFEPTRPFETNGFQDRPVMTTSVTLRTCTFLTSARAIILSLLAYVNLKFYLLFIFSTIFLLSCAKHFHGDCVRFFLPVKAQLLNNF